MHASLTQPPASPDELVIVEPSRGYPEVVLELSTLHLALLERLRPGTARRPMILMPLCQSCILPAGR